jgi:carboxylesterase type B
MGESAGAGSIMHQITAYGSSAGKPPFQQAVLQSAAFVPTPDPIQQQNTTVNFLTLLKASSIDALRQLPIQALTFANAYMVGTAPYGSFVFTPTVDGEFVPDLPGKLLLEGKFNKNVKLLIGHNANEGLLFTSPFYNTTEAIGDYINLAFPAAPPGVGRYILEELYPPPSPNNTLPYTDNIGRAAFLTAEAFFTCNTNYLSRAFDNATYDYLFSVPPAIHGQDIPYTFYGTGSNLTNSSAFPVPVNQTIAVALQNYITDFAQTGSPNGEGVPQFDLYGPQAQVLNLGQDGFTKIKDQTANERCAWWQKGLYYDPGRGRGESIEPVMSSE